MPRQKLVEVLTSDYKGPKIGLTEVHVMKAILTIGVNGSVGRGRLSEILDLGQGEVRTLIRRLKATALIRVGADGCYLTEMGRKEYDYFSKRIPWQSPVDGSALGIGKVSYGLVIREKDGRVNKGIEQRDAAIKAGASAALTVFYSKNRFLMPSTMSNCESKGPSEPWVTIRKSGNPSEGDIILVAGAENTLAAEYGALAAALTII
jgi:predicted transcriptional regulator